MVKSLLQCPSATGWWSRDLNIKISLMDLNLMLTWRKVEEHRRKGIENNEEGKETIKKLLQKHRWQMEGNCDVRIIQSHELLCKTLT